MVSGCGISIKGGNDISGDGEDGGTLKIGVENRGYGDEFAYKLAEAFEEKTGINTEVVKSSSSDWIANTMLSGAKNNDIDVFFDVANLMNTVAQKYYLEGYERAYVDLSDIYDAPLEGYNTDATLEELAYDFAVNFCTWGGDEEGYGDGKQYFVNWAMAYEGLLYNEALFDEYNLTIPRTTNEMLSLMEQMRKLENGSYATNDDGYTIYPLAYAGKNDYMYMPAYVWWAQYDGLDTFNNIMKGKDTNGNYSVDSQKSPGKLSAMQIVAQMIDPDNKFAEANSQTRLFTDAQVCFLAEQAFMMATGDWVEREMSANFEGDLEIAFMPIPINSDVIYKCTSIETDAQLSEVISYIDGENATRPSYVSDEDLAYIRSARSMSNSIGDGHVAYIPAYSDNVEAGKQFLQFMLSKEGQEIMLKYSYGNMSMLNVDMTQFDAYESLSNLQKSKYNILTKEYGAVLMGQDTTHPMAYAGGVRLFYGTGLEAYFGVDKSSGSYLTPKEAFDKEYKTATSSWEQWLTQAGVNN